MRGAAGTSSPACECGGRGAARAEKRARAASAARGGGKRRAGRCRQTVRVTQLAEHHAEARSVPLPAGPVAILDASPTTVVRGTALLVPGFTGSKEDFAPILDPLREAGYRTVAMDLPG